MVDIRASIAFGGTQRELRYWVNVDNIFSNLTDAKEARRLILAAPELLEACRAAAEDLIHYELNYEQESGRLRNYEQMEEQEAWSDTVCKLRSAIAEAEGGK